jgi:hypothetical protein
VAAVLEPSTSPYRTSPTNPANVDASPLMMEWNAEDDEDTDNASALPDTCRLQCRTQCTPPFDLSSVAHTMPMNLDAAA